MNTWLYALCRTVWAVITYGISLTFERIVINWVLYITFSTTCFSRLFLVTIRHPFYLSPILVFLLSTFHSVITTKIIQLIFSLSPLRLIRQQSYDFMVFSLLADRLLLIGMYWHVLSTWNCQQIFLEIKNKTNKFFQPLLWNYCR